MRIESKKRKVETSALVNSGFESDVPLTVLPSRLAEKLGFRAEGLEEEGYLGPGGVAIIFYPLREKLRISVLTGDKIGGPVSTEASISLGEKEVMLSDAVSSELKISILDLKRGVWRFSDEEISRESVKKEEWIFKLS